MKELELTIISTEDGIYITNVERTDEKLSGKGYLNRRYDKISIDIQTIETIKGMEIYLDSIDNIEENLNGGELP